MLQRNGWCQSVQRLADAPEQLKHTSVALYHLPYRSITGGSRIATAPGEAGGLRRGFATQQLWTQLDVLGLHV